MASEAQARELLRKLADAARRLDSHLVTRADGKLESMFAGDSERVRDEVYELVLEAYDLLDGNSTA